MNNDNKPADETQALMKSGKAAKFLGVPHRTFKRWVKTGKLCPDLVSNGGHYFFSEETLARFKATEEKTRNENAQPEQNAQKPRHEAAQPEQNGPLGTKNGPLGTKNGPLGTKNGPLGTKNGPLGTKNGPLGTKNGPLGTLEAKANPPYFDEYQNSQGKTKGQAKLVPITTRAVIKFISPEKEVLFKNTPRIFPDTQFSPKDKISNIIWNNEINIGEYVGVPTIYKSEHFGCLVKLNYDAILKSDEVITGAELSYFDRNVYDSVVTLYAAGNKMFPLQDIWRVFSQNPNAKLTEAERKKLLKSLFHIARFWVTIVTDYSEKIEVWTEKNYKSNEEHGKNFKPERKFYRKLQSSYSGQLLAFQIIANRCVETVPCNNGQDVIEKETTAEIFELGFCPILYQYAKAKGQVASTSIKLLNTSDKSNKKIVINRGYNNDELVTFLAREIDTMKKNSNYNKNILLERLYIIDGIENVQQDKNDLKKKRKQTRDKIEKILAHFKIKDIIKKYIFHKKKIGKTLRFYSVEILL